MGEFSIVSPELPWDFPELKAGFGIVRHVKVHI